MADAFAYCESLLQEADRERWLATLFAPAAMRPALFALYAFDLETAQVAHKVHEPLAGEIRLQWWHDALCGNIAEQVAGHPVAAAFIETLQSRDLPREPALGLIAARRAALYGAAVGVDAVRDAAQRSAGAVLRLASHILNDGADPQAERLSAAAALPMLVDAQALAHPPAADILAAAREDLRRVRGLIGHVPERVLPAFLPLALVSLRLKRMERGAPPDIAPWRRPWILWRAAKDLARWLD